MHINTSLSVMIGNVQRDYRFLTGGTHDFSERT